MNTLYHKEIIIFTIQIIIFFILILKIIEYFE